jgi:hypothetical protein
VGEGADTYGLYIAYFSQKKKTIQINLKEGEREAGR